MMPWTSFWAFVVIITTTPHPVLSENAAYMVRASTHPRFRTAVNMQCFAADIDNECHSDKYLRATTCSENPECLLMKGNCGWCQCPANPRDLARFGLYSRNRRLRDILARNRRDWCYLTAREAKPRVLLGNTSRACFLPKYHVTFCSGFYHTPFTIDNK